MGCNKLTAQSRITQKESFQPLGPSGSSGNAGKSSIKMLEVIGMKGPPGPPGNYSFCSNEPKETALDIEGKPLGIQGALGPQGGSGTAGTEGAPGGTGMCPTYCAVDGGMFHEGTSYVGGGSLGSADNKT